MYGFLIPTPNKCIWRNEHKMPCIYETINHYNKENGISPWRYIGSDQHDKKNYFGSNRELKQDLFVLGIANFEKKIIQYFESITNKELRQEEAKILKNLQVKIDSTYYNKTDLYAPGGGIKGMKHRHKKVVSQAWKDSHKGWTPSESTRKIWSLQRTGKKANVDTKNKMSQKTKGSNNPNALNWTIIYPDGVEVKVSGLRRYCIDNNLSYYQLYYSKNGWTTIKHGQGKGGGRRGIR